MPAYLCRALSLDPVTLAIVADGARGPKCFLSTCSRSDCEQDCKVDLLSIYEQTRPLSADAGPTLRPMIEIEKSSDKALPVTGDAAFPRATVFSQSIGEGHRMLLILHQPAGNSHLNEGTLEVVQIISQQLAKFLGCLVVWSARGRSQSVRRSIDLTDREMGMCSAGWNLTWARSSLLIGWGFRHTRCTRT